MKVAIVHDYIKEYGGAERVLEALHEMFPQAPVYTTVYCPKFLGPHRERFKNWEIRTSIVQYLPFKEKLISPLRIISPFLFRQFDFSQYDIIIVSATGAYFPNCIKVKSQKSKVKNESQNLKVQESHSPFAIRHKPIHICYCHTPPRYLYGYMTARDWKNNPFFRFFGEIANHFLRIVDAEASQNVDFYIANSEEVKRRIRKFYRREAIVINPPAVDSKIFNFQFSIFNESSKSKFLNKKLNANSLDAKRYYLTGGRLARAKGIDIIIDAFIKLGKPLKIFGKGFAGFEEQLKVQSSKFKVDNVEFFGEVSDEEKFKLMKDAKAFVFASYDEDFGITPVEAMSVGTPVIAYKSGGVQETVIDGKTGVFYQQNTPEELIKAVQKFEKLTFNPKNCINQAQKFSKEKFLKQIKDFIQQNAH